MKNPEEGKHTITDRFLMGELCYVEGIFRAVSIYIIFPLFFIWKPLCSNVQLAYHHSHQQDNHNNLAL